MNQAWILTEVGSNQDKRVSRLQNLTSVIEACGFKARILGREGCDEHAVKRVLIQHTDEPWRISYCDHALQHLEAAKNGDVIIATEDWHSYVFRGLLNAVWDGPPVVEVWIDYLNSFAPWRAFSTEYCRTLTLGLNGGDRSWNPRWTVTYPYFEPQEQLAILETFEAAGDGLDLSHVEHMIKGVPVLAPDCGTFVETVEHGKSGIRYKSPKAREYGRDRVLEIQSTVVARAAGERFSLEQARLALGAFLKRAIHEGTHKTS